MKETIIILWITMLSHQAIAQTKNLVVEGSDDQIAVIHTTSMGSSYSGIDLLRATEFTGTDWRIVNEGGLFKLQTGLDNFLSSATDNLLMSTSGRLQLLEGSEATIGDDSGVLVLGKSDGLNLSLDQNEILARDGERTADLFLQAGNPAGNTFLNIASGNVGIGSLTPKVRLGVEDSDFQLRVANTQQLTNEWFIGASHTEWRSGGDKLVFSPTDNEGDAMLSLDRSNNTIDAEGHRIVNVNDPVNDLDAVNLRTLRQTMNPSQIGGENGSFVNFYQCVSTCRDLVEDDNSDWRVPSVAELALLVDDNNNSGFGAVWTTDLASDFAYFKELNPNAQNSEYAVYHIAYNFTIGRAKLSSNEETRECACIR